MVDTSPTDDYRTMVRRFRTAQVFLKAMRHLTVFLMLGLLLAVDAVAGSIWYEDNSFARGGVLPDDFIFQFTQPESWSEARDALDVYMFRVNVFNSDNYPQLTDRFWTEQAIPLLRNSQVRVALDTAAPLLAGCRERSARIRVEMDWVARIKRLGMDVDYVSLQSLLSKRYGGEAAATECSLAERGAAGLSVARQYVAFFPEAQIGIIDALPSHGKPYKEAYKYLRDLFRSRDLPLNYIHLDVSADMIERGINGLSWQKIIEVEQYVRSLGLDFGLLFTSRKAGYASDEAFFRTISRELDDYLVAGGAADHYLITSWFPHPLRSVRRSPTEAGVYPVTDAITLFSRRLRTSPASEAGQPDHTRTVNE